MLVDERCVIQLQFDVVGQADADVGIGADVGLRADTVELHRGVVEEFNFGLHAAGIDGGGTEILGRAIRREVAQGAFWCRVEKRVAAFVRLGIFGVCCDGAERQAEADEGRKTEADAD